MADQGTTDDLASAVSRPPDHPSRVVVPVDAEELLHNVPGGVALVDAAGTILWTNDAPRVMGGYDPEAMIGTNLLDYVDLGWNPLSIESIGYALDHPGQRLPTMLGMRTADGRLLVVEATANNQLHNPKIGGLVVHLRPCTEQQLLDQVLEAIAHGVEPEETLSLLAPVAAGDTLDAECGVILDAPGAAPTVVVASPAIGEMLESSAPDTAWALARSTNEEIFMSTADLPPTLRDMAHASGFQACWALPVTSSQADGALAILVFWRRDPSGPEPSAKLLLDRLVRLTGLVLARSAMAQRLLHAASHDQLTGLANRSTFFDRVDTDLRSAEPHIGVLYMDLDRFKLVNDHHGHGHGDAVLRHIGSRIAGAVGAEGLVARLGGDEFALCAKSTSMTRLVDTARELIEAVGSPVIHMGHVHRVGATVGVAVAEAGACSADVLVAAADGALLAAKATAKGTWRGAPLIAAT